MKRSWFPVIIILSMLLSLSGSITSVRASAPFPSLDLDQDGLANSLETGGWYNLTGGPYQTDPTKADTDGDGLTDAEEKLFNTNPLDATNPGIAVKYDSAYKTREYFSTSDPAYISMVQGGNQYLLKEALVVRRGTSFNVAAVNAEPASLSISGSDMTAITPIRDRARGGWEVSLPNNGTVGQYTATITNGSWSKSMPIYVIFELPATDAYMTDAKIKAFLYDDDPANKKDEVAVWWRVRDFSYYYYNGAVQTTPPTATDCQVDTPGDCSLDQYHLNYGYAQAFWTEQFTKKVLLDYTLPAIQGESAIYNAADNISHKADQSVRVNYSAQYNSFSSATHYDIDPNLGYHMTGGACETNSGVFTSMLRSVGIAARPFNLDYNKTPGHNEGGNFGQYEYDHAVMMWLKGSTDAAPRWYADRIAVQSEPEYQPTPSWEGGTTGRRLFEKVGATNLSNLGSGFGKFRDYYADLVQSVNEDWDWQNGSLGGGMVNMVWPIPDAEYDNEANPADPFLNRDYKWDSYQPLKMNYQSPYLEIYNCQLWKNDGWAPGEWYDPAANPPDPLYYSNPLGRNATNTYRLWEFPDPKIPDPANPIENWPYNPKPNQCSPSSVDDPACTAAFKSGSLSCALLPGQTTFGSPAAASQAVPQAQAPAVNTELQLGNITGAAGLDQNGDGRFEKFVVTVELTSAVSGEYQLGGFLQAGEDKIRADASQVSLIAGLQTVEVVFDGQAIGDNHVDGPYQVTSLWAAPASQAVDQMVVAEEMAAYQEYTFQTQDFSASAFAVQAAAIGADFSFSTTDSNGNGAADSLTVSVPLAIAIPGSFSLQADLYDGQGNFVGQAEWSGSDPVALLEYPVTGTQAPYSLEHVNLFNAQGALLDARYASIYKIEDLTVEQGAVRLSSEAAGLAPQALTPPSNFSLTPVDSNANGKYDQLVVSAKVDVTGAGGSFRMEGLLVDDRGLPAAWAVSDPQTLNVGTGQTITLSFDARLLQEMPFASSQKFTLVAAKVFSGNLNSPSSLVEVPVTGFATPAYTRTQLEPSSLYTPFEDDMEGGAAKWSLGGSLWSQVSSLWHSWSHAWGGEESTAKSGTLSVASPINLSDYASPWLRFNTAYQLAGSDSLKLEASTNGTTWTTLKTYSAGATSYWASEIVDLSAYGKVSSLRLRFNGQMTSGHDWKAYLDDVVLTAGPAVKSSSISGPSSVTRLTNVTFTADYTSINKGVPVTYKWDFCGVTRDVTTPTIVYQFPSTGSCQVKLSVDNTYDSTAATPLTVSVNQPVFLYLYLPVTIR